VRAQEARDLGKTVAALVQMAQPEDAYALLAPVLAQRTPFRLLRYIGEAVGGDPKAGDLGGRRRVNAFLKRIAAEGTEGGWVIIASALAEQLRCDAATVFAQCRGFIVTADVWYAADIMGEGVLGIALVNEFKPSLALLAPWREDANPWVRRAVGTSAHFWAKRSGGAPEKVAKAEALLAFLEPMFGEWDMTAVKGVGWGLKTLGRTYPDLVADWLANEICPDQRRHRTLMLRKALTHLSEEQRARAIGKA
jgi:3-methyladenine DNA glycosylase AlkD